MKFFKLDHFNLIFVVLLLSFQVIYNLRKAEPSTENNENFNCEVIPANENRTEQILNEYLPKSNENKEKYFMLFFLSKILQNNKFFKYTLR